MSNTIKDYIIDEKYTVLKAMEAINNNAKGIVLVCDGMKLKAVVTDGNIRRYILNNGDLHANVSSVANYKPITIRNTENINKKYFLKTKQINALPTLNEKGEVVSIDFHDDISVYKTTDLNLPVVIMAGGKGTRLQPFTEVLPKPLIPISDKTITEIIMEEFEKFGCYDFNMIVNYKSSLIKAYFSESGSAHNVRFTDEEKYLGTGGGLKLIDGEYDSTFFMSNCDIVIKDDYGEFFNYHKKHKNIITMICAHMDITIPYGTVELSDNGQVEKLSEKPTMSFLSNTGLYLIEPELFNYIPENENINITTIIENCIALGERVGTYPISEKSWFDIGQITELEKTKNYFIEKE